MKSCQTRYPHLEIQYWGWKNKVWTFSWVTDRHQPANLDCNKSSHGYSTVLQTTKQYQHAQTYSLQWTLCPSFSTVFWTHHHISAIQLGQSLRHVLSANTEVLNWEKIWLLNFPQIVCFDIFIEHQCENCEFSHWPAITTIICMILAITEWKKLSVSSSTCIEVHFYLWLRKWWKSHTRRTGPKIPRCLMQKNGRLHALNPFRSHSQILRRDSTWSISLTHLIN